MKGNKKTFLFPICFFDWQIMTCLCNSNTEYLVFCYLKFAASFSDSTPKYISVQTVDWETKNELNNSLCAMLLCCWYRKGGSLSLRWKGYYECSMYTKWFMSRRRSSIMRQQFHEPCDGPRLSVRRWSSCSTIHWFRPRATALQRERDLT